MLRRSRPSQMRGGWVVVVVVGATVVVGGGTDVVVGTGARVVVAIVDGGVLVVVVAGVDVVAIDVDVSVASEPEHEAISTAMAAATPMTRRCRTPADTRAPRLAAAHH